MSKARNLADVISGAFDVPAGALDNAVSSWDDLTGKPTYFTGRKNLIINGAMQITQRGSSYTGVTGSGYYALDRFRFALSSVGTWSLTQSSDSPSGFSNSYKVDCTTADTPIGADDLVYVQYKMEGQDVQHLKYGTASAETVTLSFWVKSTKTGTYIVDLYQTDGDDVYPKTYTINSADTWEYKTLTFEGNTSSSIANDNTVGITIDWWLAAGSSYSSGTLNTTWGASTNANRAVGQVNLADSTANDWYITGVQLELGDTATAFEHRNYSEELTLCQRYYYVLQDTANKYISSGEYVNTNELGTTVIYPVTMRSSPTLKQTTGTDYYYGYSGGYDWFNNWQAIDNNTRRSGYVYANTSQVSGTTGKAVKIGTGSGGFLAFEAEL